MTIEFGDEGGEALMKRALMAVVCAVVMLPVPRASADPTTDAVCTGFRLGMSQSEIAERLQRNDGRINSWQAWRDTNWPIINGDCDD